MTILPAAWWGGIRSCRSCAIPCCVPRYMKVPVSGTQSFAYLSAGDRSAASYLSPEMFRQTGRSLCFVTDDAIPGYLGTTKWAFCIARGSISGSSPRGSIGECEWRLTPAGWPLDCTREVGVLWVYARRQVPVEQQAAQ